MNKNDEIRDLLLNIKILAEQRTKIQSELDAKRKDLSRQLYVMIKNLPIEEKMDLCRKEARESVEVFHEYCEGLGMMDDTYHHAFALVRALEDVITIEKLAKAIQPIL